MEVALCIIVASYFAFAFSDLQSVLYIAAVAYVLHTFINNPRLFSNGLATTTPHTILTDHSVHIDQQAPVVPPHKQPSPNLPTATTPTPTTRATTSPIPSTRSSQPTRKPSRYTFDSVNGGVVHSQFGSPRQTLATLASPSSALASPSITLASPSGLRRPHRVPDVSAGRSPILPVLTASPVSYLPTEQLEPSPVARAEMFNRVVRTEMVTKPRLALETKQATPTERSPHRRIGSHHHRHHHSHSRSHHRHRSSRSPMSFSDATAAGSGDQDYDSDSSRASTSSTRSTTSSHRSSYGLPSYEKHVRCWRHQPFVLLF